MFKHCYIILLLRESVYFLHINTGVCFGKQYRLITVSSFLIKYPAHTVACKGGHGINNNKDPCRRIVVNNFFFIVQSSN